MTCEKQLAPVHNHGIYCSESCRRSDQASSAAQMPRSYTTAAYRPQHHGASSSHSNRHSYFGTSPTNYLYASDDDTYYASDDGDDASYPSRRADIIPQASPTMLASSPPMTPGTTSSAMEALRASLSMATRPPSPPSPLGSWSLTGGAPSAAGGGSYTASSYSRPSSTYRLSTTYDAPPGAGYHTGSPERPLPSRYPGYGSRPKSIELVTPMLR